MTSKTLFNPSPCTIPLCCVDIGSHFTLLCHMAPMALREAFRALAAYRSNACLAYIPTPKRVTHSDPQSLRLGAAGRGAPRSTQSGPKPHTKKMQKTVTAPQGLLLQLLGGGWVHAWLFASCTFKSNLAILLACTVEAWGALIFAGGLIKLSCLPGTLGCWHCHAYAGAGTVGEQNEVNKQSCCIGLLACIVFSRTETKKK